LALVAVSRLREALETLVARAVTAQRAAQLRVVVELEGALHEVLEALASHTATRAIANDRADQAFWQAEDAIGDGLAEIFSAEGALATSRRPHRVH
jgi:hypothetical protein